MGEGEKSVAQVEAMFPRLVGAGGGGGGPSGGGKGGG